MPIETDGGRPLDGVTILDLTHMLSGPYGSMMLADLGAHTIKIEAPGKGEKTRDLLRDDVDHTVDGVGVYYLSLNRNKKSIALNLKSAEGREVFLDLVRRADVVLDNFSVGALKRLDLDNETLRGINPRIITCSITGFGGYGPETTQPAFDMVVQAKSGGMSITGDEGCAPMRSGIPIGDVCSGLFAAIGVLSALQKRASTGYGQHVDVSMLDCQVSMLNYIAAMYLHSGILPKPVGNSHSMHVPYNVYPTQNGHLVLACIGDEFFLRLAQCLDDPRLNKPDYRTQQGRLRNKEEIELIIKEHLIEHSTASWLERFNSARIPCAPVNTLEEALSDPQIRARSMVVPVTLDSGKEIKLTGVPIKFSRDNNERFSAPPEVGRDTATLLRDFMGYSEEKLAQLIETGNVA